jgi:hypothetical protein
MKSFLKIIIFVGIAVGLVAWTPIAAAHHGAQAFDLTKKTTITGLVTEMRWQNPHVFLSIDGTSKEGEKSAIWMMESLDPGTLTRCSWNKSSFKAGDKVIASIAPLRNGKPGGYLLNITYAETGKTLCSRESAEEIDRPNADQPLPTKPEVK